MKPITKLAVIVVIALLYIPLAVIGLILAPFFEEEINNDNSK